MHARHLRILASAFAAAVALTLAPAPGVTADAEALTAAAAQRLGGRPPVTDARHFNNGGFQRLHWGSVRGAAYYQVYVKQGDYDRALPRNWRLLKTVEGTATTVHIAQGQTRQFGVRAVGRPAGMRRAVTAISSFGTVSRPPRLRALDREGGWHTMHKRAFYRDTALRTRRPGARLTLRGADDTSSVRLVAVTGPRYGSLDVYVGGRKVKHIDLGRRHHNPHKRLIARLSQPRSGAITLVHRGRQPVRISALGHARRATTATRTPKAPLSRPPARSFTFRGSGWGHGVGLSQYGARAMAEAGRSTKQILQHYYSGTRLGRVDDDRELDINVSYHASPVVVRLSALGRGADAEVCAMKRRRCADSVVTHDRRANDRPAGSIVVTRHRGRVQARVKQPDGDVHRLRGDRIRVRWSGTRYRDGSAAVVRLGSGREYRHGELLVTKHGSSLLNAAIRVELQSEYLRGVAEMPSSWDMEALRAQAIIARTYALKSGRGKRSDCDCHLVDSVLDQSYVGWGKESEGRDAYYGKRWVRAVTSTDGTALTYQGALASTFYFSSSGGHTLNARDVWSASVPYLRSVPDRWSMDGANPNRHWSSTRSGAAMSDLFGLGRIHKISVVRRFAGGAVHAVRATAVNGATRTIRGKADYLRSKLGLKSAWVTSIDETY
ncbi:MAG TPA: SpoIID/LytB domain-containing protein [Nocardioidaceae bacterium]|nr:SpoIID/LytB domain-containing protein [Nocardioidaceae bacterium]